MNNNGISKSFENTKYIINISPPKMGSIDTKTVDFTGNVINNVAVENQDLTIKTTLLIIIDIIMTSNILF